MTKISSLTKGRVKQAMTAPISVAVVEDDPRIQLLISEEITDRVKALDAGVDDYLIKPFPSTN